MYIQRRFPFKSVIIWTKRELIFFIIFATIVTVLHQILNIHWLQIPLTPVGIIGTAVAFMVGFQNNAAYDRIWEARKIWGGIVNASRTLIINVRDSFYIHNSGAKQDESENVKIIANRHIAWLTALRFALRSRKSWEASYESIHKKASFSYNVPEYTTKLEDELEPYLSKEDLYRPD